MDCRKNLDARNAKERSNLIMAAYAEPADMLALFDARSLGALVKDDGTRGSPTELLTDPNLAAALAAASGRVEAAMLHGGRYSVADLESLTDNSLAYLKKLVCDVAFVTVWSRRPFDELKGISQVCFDHSEAALESLRQGREVFNLTAQIAAGLPPAPTGPTRVQLHQLNTIAGRARGRFYPDYVLPGNR